MGAHEPAAVTDAGAAPAEPRPKVGGIQPKADLREMQLVIGDEVKRVEIIGEALRQTEIGGLGAIERRRLFVLKQILRTLELLEAHEDGFRKLTAGKKK